MTYVDIPKEITYRAFDDAWIVEKVTNFSGCPFNNLYIEGRFVCQISALDKDDIIKKCTKWICSKLKRKCTFDDFVNDNIERLGNYSRDSEEFYIDCYYICEKSNPACPNYDLISSAVLEHKGELKKIASQYSSPLDSDTVCSLQWNIGLIASFFVFGGISYVFKHLIAFFWDYAVMIIWSIANFVYSLFCLLFDVDGDGVAFDPDDLLAKPLTVWQVGGWIYGIIIVCILLWEFIKWVDKR